MAFIYPHERPPDPNMEYQLDPKNPRTQLFLKDLMTLRELIHTLENFDTLKNNELEAQRSAVLEEALEEFRVVERDTWLTFINEKQLAFKLQELNGELERGESSEGEPSMDLDDGKIPQKGDSLRLAENLRSLT